MSRDVTATKKTDKKDFESGQIIFYYALGITISLLLIALVFDLGMAAVTFQKASTATQAAAFAAAQQLDMDEFRVTNEVKLHPGQAVSAAGTYGSLNSDKLSILSVAASGDKVIVVGSMQYQSIFAQVIGFGSFEARITAIASPAYGVDQRGQ